MSGAEERPARPERLPRHVAISTDGNGRWAALRGLSRQSGHEAGAEAFHRAVGSALELGVEYLTVHAFSTENWRRPTEEVDFLFTLYDGVLQTLLPLCVGRGIRVTHLGRRDPLPSVLRQRLSEIEAATRDGAAMRLQLCVGYGGRSEVADAARRMVQLAAVGRLAPESVDEQMLSRFLYLPDLPDVDLFIRTSGEQRMSNFMTWQSTYAELLFPEVLWPDFTGEHLAEALRVYASRNRRFGQVPSPEAPGQRHTAL